MKNKLAPIILFVYNRPWHTQQTIEALQKNELADQSDLIIYSDAPNNDQACSQVQEVRDYIKTVYGFKLVKIIERDINWGLAANIIDGVTEVVNQYGKVIVMEDDIVTSSAYLSFMNQSLNFYQNEKKVWHISGWNYPIDTCGLGDVFFWRMMNCWGWATWSDRWSSFKKDKEYFLEAFARKDIKKDFNLNDSIDFYSHLVMNRAGKLNTWAIYWYAVIYENDGLSLNPAKTYVKNIGFDGSGTNCGKSSSQSLVEINDLYEPYFSSEIKPSKLARSRVIGFYKKRSNLIFRIKNKVFKWLKI